MAKKKGRAFFICPRWNEVVETLRTGAPGTVTPIRVNEKDSGRDQGGPARRSINAPQGFAGPCARRRGLCSTWMPTSWTSAPNTRDLSGAAPVRKPSRGWFARPPRVVRASVQAVSGASVNNGAGSRASDGESCWLVHDCSEQGSASVEGDGHVPEIEARSQ
jgi:hypothetical protein